MSLHINSIYSWERLRVCMKFSEKTKRGLEFEETDIWQHKTVIVFFTNTPTPNTMQLSETIYGSTAKLLRL